MNPLSGRMDKTMCEHNTTIVKYDQGNVQVEVCKWGCGQTIISVKSADAVTESFTAAELATLRARVEAGISPEELAHALGIEYDNAKSTSFYLMLVKLYRLYYEAGKKA